MRNASTKKVAQGWEIYRDHRATADKERINFKLTLAALNMRLDPTEPPIREHSWNVYSRLWSHYVAGGSKSGDVATWKYVPGNRVDQMVAPKDRAVIRGEHAETPGAQPGDHLPEAMPTYHEVPQWLLTDAEDMLQSWLQLNRPSYVGKVEVVPARSN